MSFVWTPQRQAQCQALAGDWIAAKPVSDHPEGMTFVIQSLISQFVAAGFNVERIENPTASHRPLLIAKRVSVADSPWIGFFGHYDVEQADSAEWHTDPHQLTEMNDRWYGRGIGDNLLPLAQKVCLFDDLFRNSNVLYFLQGEEETGGPFAHAVCPNLKLPDIALWIEETGYFYRDGRQRLLTLQPDAMLTQMLEAIYRLLEEEGLGWKEHHRTLNKTIGGKQCPCHQHLLQQKPYVAIGPNDDDSAIHDKNESINPALLAIPARQLQIISEVAAAG